MSAATDRAGAEQPAAVAEESEEAQAADEASAEAPAGLALEELLPPAGPAVTWTGVRSGRAIARKGRACQVLVRGEAGPLTIPLAPEVDGEVVDDAIANRDLVMVEVEPDGQPVVVGALRSRIPEKLRLRAQQIEIEGEREVLIRSGRAAARLRSDGDVEIVGSRISASSRGLFRLVGRILRLN